MKTQIATASIVLLLLSACTTATGGASVDTGVTSPETSGVSTPSPSPSPTTESEPVPARFDTVEGLRDALVAGGYDCPAWKRDDRVTLALQSGQCSDADVLMIFTGESAVHEASQNLKAMGSTIVVGENWIVNPKTPIAVTHAIGGTIVKGAGVP